MGIRNTFIFNNSSFCYLPGNEWKKEWKVRRRELLPFFYLLSYGHMDGDLC